jgi:hypothetical protein
MGQAFSDYEKRWQDARREHERLWQEDRARQIAERDRIRALDDEKRRQLWTTSSK